jgi:serine/threonine protein kinase
MGLSSERWIEITPSQFPWEREALAFIRERLPDHDPYRVWTNFEFIGTDGSFNEVDALVLTPMGFYLVEIKSRPGNIDGDASTWTWTQDGRRFTDDNPLILANRKAKKLVGLLGRTRAMKQVRLPFLEPRVFLSDETNRIDLPEHVAAAVHTRDPAEPLSRGSGRGIVAALTRWDTDNPPRLRIDRPIAKALTRAMEEAGIRASQRARKVGDYRLDRLLFEGPTYQDWAATHVALDKERARVRIYVVEPGASADARATIVKAARREYSILAGISHPGILKAKGYTEHERGPALIYEYLPGSQRLDHYLAERGERLSVDARLDLLRQVAEAVRYAHGKHIYHRALSPQNILVLDPEAPAPRLQILNWETATRDGSGLTRGMTTLGLSATSHLANHIEEASAVYMAPETLAGRGEAGEQADVFSLGALAFHLFSGKPPARSFLELCERLREGRGLKISSVLDGAAESLQYLIQASTHPEVSARLDTVGEFLEALDAFEDEITTPEPREGLVADPTQAKAGDILSDGLVVKRTIGKGASSLALLVEHGGKEQVLKVALEPPDNARLKAEAQVLRRLRRHQYIVQIQDERDYQGRAGILMDKAGDKTLAQRLREEGALHLELLERFGEDLLQAVDWLEQEGVAHRDIKPENLGVALMGKGEQLHLLLFDFSLADTPAEDIRAGSVPYPDPFLALRRPPRWDTYAERFAAAVTLYQMATASLPTWGDGHSDPAVIEAEVSLDRGAFDASLRDPMGAFFAKALARDYRTHYDNARDMLAAWRTLFAGAARPEVGTDHGEDRAPITSLEVATLDTLLPELGLSPRALNAVERASLRTVRDLIHYPLAQIRRLRGVGSKTRRELAECMQRLAQRFPEVAAGPKILPKTQPGPTALPDVPAGPDEVPAIDGLAALLVPRIAQAGRGAEGQAGAQSGAQAVLGLLALSDGAPAGWPSQSEVPRRLSVNPALVSHAVAAARQRWQRAPALTALREDIVALLDAQGGVMTAAELAEALLASRGSLQDEPLRSRQALAVLRAAVETERDRAVPRWVLRRTDPDGQVLLARDEPADDGSSAVDGERLADYAEALGQRADALSQEDPLRPPGRVLEALQAVEPPPGVTRPAAGRLLQLAAAVSRAAALSSRLELYPRGMAAARALKLALGALGGARELTVEQVRERIAGRYPQAEPLPERPALDTLLEQAGSELTWQPEARAGQGAYLAPLRDFNTVVSATLLTRRSFVARRFEEIPADRVEIDQFEQRLRHSCDHQGFLALLVSPGRVGLAEAVLANAFPVQVTSLDRGLIGHMKSLAREKRIDWRVVLRADAVASGERDASRDWTNLQRLVAAALPRVQAELAASPRLVVLTNPGLLARYQRLGFLDDLRETAGRPGGPPGLWVLIPADGQQQRPMLDGQPVPVFTSAQWERIPDLWLAAHQPQALAS